MSTKLHVIEPASAGRIDQADTLLFRFEAHLDLKPIGLTPEGLRMANTYEGMATQGAFAGSRVRGTDQLLLRRDGVCVIDAQTLLTRPGGEQLYEHVNGYCLPPEGLELPPLDALLDPGFVWPDIDFPILATSTFRAGMQSDAGYLNRVIARIDGWVNFSSGKLVVDTVLVTHDSTVVRAA